VVYPREFPLTIYLATGNLKKCEEVAQIVSSHALSASVVVISGFESPEENGQTFLENATLKACAGARQLLAAGVPGPWLVVGEDSGLVVEGLSAGVPWPGVHSNRWLDHQQWTALYPPTPYPDVVSDACRNEALRAVIDERSLPAPVTGYYAATLAVVASDAPDQPVTTAEGRMPLQILPSAEPPRGAAGFGYDPITQPLDPSGALMRGGRTTAELTPQEKAAISHRGQAWRTLARWLSDADDDTQHQVL
jgi:XTP/dITP diphosphohydrolase